MKFIQRLGYYLGGFTIGLILLLFFLNGKEASCDYGPNARTVKNISSKPMHYSINVIAFIAENSLDSLTLTNLVKFGNVDFSKSDTKLDSCKTYHIENSYKEKRYVLKIKNCDSIAKLMNISYIHSK